MIYDHREKGERAEAGPPSLQACKRPRRAILTREDVKCNNYLERAKAGQPLRFETNSHVFPSSVHILVVSSFTILAHETSCHCQLSVSRGGAAHKEKMSDSHR